MCIYKICDHTSASGGVKVTEVCPISLEAKHLRILKLKEIETLQCLDVIWQLGWDGLRSFFLCCVKGFIVSIVTCSKMEFRTGSMSQFLHLLMEDDLFGMTGNCLWTYMWSWEWTNDQAANAWENRADFRFDDEGSTADEGWTYGCAAGIVDRHADGSSSWQIADGIFKTVGES